MKELLEILKEFDENKDMTPIQAHDKILRLFNIKRSDYPKCDKCGADETKQSCLGKWEDGEEYRCDVCGHEWEFHHFEYQ